MDDDDCEGSLVCFQRSSGNIAVPGCTGGEDEAADHDYCYDPSTPLPTQEPATDSPTDPPTRAPRKDPTQPDDASINTTYTVYSFAGGNVMEAGCSFTHSGVVAACRSGQLQLSSLSDHSNVCSMGDKYNDGSSRITCTRNSTCTGTACEDVVLWTPRRIDIGFGNHSTSSGQTGEVEFLCESTYSTHSQRSTFTCGASGIVLTNSSDTVSRSLYNVEKDEDFLWGLFDSNLCLNQGSPTILVDVERDINSRNPDLNEP